jgi:mediator of RNA polymerase II transcription subunit 7
MAMQEHHLGSQLPHPPRYFKLFSSDTLTRPPAPPRIELIGNEYEMFGARYHVRDELPSLIQQGVKDILYDETTMRDNPVPTLKVLLRSLLREYLQLLDTLTIGNPSQSPNHVETIRNILIHMHHTLNSYRPREAIEMIKGWLRETSKSRDKQCGELEELLLDLCGVLSKWDSTFEKGPVS